MRDENEQLGLFELSEVPLPQRPAVQERSEPKSQPASLFAEPEAEPQFNAGQADQEFSFEIEGQPVRVEYKPFYSRPMPEHKFAGIDHFEFYGEATSSTGYRSHFVNPEAIGDSPEEYARALALALAEELKPKKRRRKAKPKVVEPVECPVDDPSCTSTDAECHDACEPEPKPVEQPRAYDMRGIAVPCIKCRGEIRHGQAAYITSKGSYHARQEQCDGTLARDHSQFG